MQKTLNNILIKLRDPSKGFHPTNLEVLYKWTPNLSNINISPNILHMTRGVSGEYISSTLDGREVSRSENQGSTRVVRALPRQISRTNIVRKDKDDKVKKENTAPTALGSLPSETPAADLLESINHTAATISLFTPFALAGDTYFALHGAKEYVNGNILGGTLYSLPMFARAIPIIDNSNLVNSFRLYKQIKSTTPLSSPVFPKIRTRYGDIEIDDPNLFYRQGGSDMGLDFLATGVVNGDEMSPLFKAGSLWYGLEDVAPRTISPVEARFGLGPKTDLLVSNAPMSKATLYGRRFIILGPSTNLETKITRADASKETTRRVPLYDGAANSSNTSLYRWEPGYGFKLVKSNDVSLMYDPKLASFPIRLKYPLRFTGEDDRFIAGELLDFPEFMRNYQAHGIKNPNIQESFNLIRTLLDQGINPQKKLYTAPLQVNAEDASGIGSALGTSGGTYYKQSLITPYWEPNVNPTISNLKGILLNDGFESPLLQSVTKLIYDYLRKSYPNMKINFNSEFMRKVPETKVPETKVLSQPTNKPSNINSESLPPIPEELNIVI